MKFCPNCGAKVLIDNAKFCMECGNSFKDFTNSISESAVEKNNFFSEAIDSNASENDGDFFSDMGEVVKKEDNVNKSLIEDATRYFIQGDVRAAERILSDIINKDDKVRHMLAVIYQVGGEGVDIDHNKAVDLLITEYMNGILCVNVFNEYYRNGNESESEYNDMMQRLAVELPKAERECEGVFEEYELGMFYLIETKYKNINKGQMFLERAASHGMWPAQCVLGAAYENGLFGRSDYKKAYQYYEKAAIKGMALAAQCLGTMLYWGNGCKVNHKEAKRWYLIGARQNDPLCIHQVGVLYEEEENYHEAIKWLEKSASLQNSPYQENSCAELGLLLLNGNSVPTIPTNHVRGYQLIQMALSLNPKNGEALLGLAICYFYEDIPDMEDVEPEQRIAMFKKYCSEAIKYSDGLIREEARNALAQFEQMERESANQQSEGCFITTAVCDIFGKDDDCYELTMFRDFRDSWLLKQPDGNSLVDEYYKIAPRIVESINRLDESKTIYMSIWEQYLKPCLSYIERKDDFSCKEKYIEMVKNLRSKYLDDEKESK